jgi:uncharacterized membrane protein YedE/YeeE
MWIIWSILGVSLPIFAVCLYGWWNNRQVDKDNEWKKQQEEQEKRGVPA